MTKPNRLLGDWTTGLSRRQFVATTTTLTVASMAGCSGILGGGDGGSGPKATVRNFVEALDSGNVDEANGMVHPDSPTGELSQQYGEFFEQADVAVDNLEVVEENDDSATVRVTLTMGVQGEEQTNEGEMTLRKHDGEWKLYEGIQE